MLLLRGNNYMPRLAFLSYYFLFPSCHYLFLPFHRRPFYYSTPFLEFLTVFLSAKMGQGRTLQTYKLHSLRLVCSSRFLIRSEFLGKPMFRQIQSWNTQRARNISRPVAIMFIRLQVL